MKKLSPSFRLYRSTEGFSLIEILVATAIGAIVMMAFTSFLVTQQREMRWLLNKADIVEAKTNLLRALQNAGVCTWQLKDKEFNATGVTVTNPSETEIVYDKIYEGATATSKVLLESGTGVTRSNASLKVTKIAIANILETGNAGVYSGDLMVSFSDAANTRKYQPLTVSLRFQASSPSPSTRKITSCSTETAAPVAAGSCDWNSNLNTDISTGLATCTESLGRDVLESEVPAAERADYVWIMFSNPKIARRKLLKSVPNGFWVPPGVFCKYDPAVGCGSTYTDSISCAGGVAVPTYKSYPCADQSG